MKRYQSMSLPLASTSHTPSLPGASFAWLSYSQYVSLFLHCYGSSLLPLHRMSYVPTPNTTYSPYHRLADVTALWNTNAFFAYLLTVKLFHLKWEPRRLGAVVLATVGAAAVVYGGSSKSDGESTDAQAAGAKAALFGDMLTLVASVIYGVYQVLYKMYAALPTEPHHIPVEQDYEPIVDSSEDPSDMPLSDKPEMVYPPPFGLYANALTSAIGISTLLLLWIPIPILHYYGLETFRLPGDMKTVLVIVGISLSGVAFNAGLMVRLDTI